MNEHNYSLDIDAYDILDLLKVQTAYLGAKILQADGNAYERISMTDGNIDFVRPAMDSATSVLCNALKRYAPKMDDGTLSLIVPTNLLSVNQASTENAIKLFYVSYVMYKWLAITNPAMAENYMNEATMHLTTARNMLAKRKAPTYSAPTEETETATD